MSPIIAPSILASDFANLEKEAAMLNSSNADWFHIDVMDGVFVPNISFGMPVIKSLRKHSSKPFDVHLMIVQPERYIKEFNAVGADILTVHIEATNHLHRTIQSIKQEGMKAGVALNPHTPIHSLEDIISDIDLVCLMSVNPGFGGQKFIENTYKKIEQLSLLIQSTGSHAQIEIDGGVTSDNAKQLMDSGAHVLVAGSFVFSSADPIATIKDLKEI